jgi:hypothetical protein
VQHAGGYAGQVEEGVGDCRQDKDGDASRPLHPRFQPLKGLSVLYHGLPAKASRITGELTQRLTGAGRQADEQRRQGAAHGKHQGQAGRREDDCRIAQQADQKDAGIADGGHLSELVAQGKDGDAQA